MSFTKLNIGENVIKYGSKTNRANLGVTVMWLVSQSPISVI